MTDPRCPLCAAPDSSPFHDDPRRGRYFRCARCALVFLHPEHRPTPLAEVMRYQEHRNDAADEGYVRFLRRLADPMLARLAPGSEGLDFGCGPTPALAGVMRAAGHPTASYDPLFRPDRAALARTYGFLTCSEVLEHVHDPAGIFRLFAALVDAGGMIGIMTRFYGHEAPFERWWYRRDPTHVCFYCEETMRWVAEQRGWVVDLPAPHVAIFRLPAGHDRSRA